MLNSKMFKTGCLIVAVMLFITETSFAKELEMKVFDDSLSGRAALVGKYHKAIELAEVEVDSAKVFKRMMAATNLCVAYTKVALLEKAESYCEMAITDSASVSKKRFNDNFLTASGEKISLLEIAKSNYAVLQDLRVKKQLAANIN